MDEIRRLLAKAERVESLSAQIYRLLASVFSEGAIAWNIYQRLAKEEDEHAQRIRLLADRIEARPYLPELRVDPAGLDALIAEAESLLRTLQEDGAALSAEDGRRFVVALERNFGAVHAHALVAGDPELETFFAELAFQDQMHLDVLERLGGGPS
ncbi:MAG: hypothetical protein QM765_50425 [Myxococcales bacterium]